MATITERIRAAWLALPTSVQLFAVDVVLALATLVVGLNLAIPNTLPEAKAELLLVVSAVAGASVRILAKATVRYLWPALVAAVLRVFPRPA